MMRALSASTAFFVAVILALAGCSKEDSALHDFKNSSAGQEVSKCVGANGSINWKIFKPTSFSNPDVRVINADLEKGGNTFQLQWIYNLNTKISEVSFLGKPGEKSTNRAFSVSDFGFFCLSSSKGPRPIEKVIEKVPVVAFRDCSDCPEMVVIPAGSFEMGGTGSDEQPVHRVTLRSFSMGKTEVTQGQWRAIMGSNPSRFSTCGDTCPVERVSWEDAKEFVSSLNAKTGKTYRLPSEAEWEYACRAGGRQEYCGSDSADNVGWYSGRSTHPVAGKKANAWGLHDMSGNVFEWTEDCYNGNYSSAPTDGSAWTAGDCSLRVVRGGSWVSDPQNLRSASRGSHSTAFRLGIIGFRVARTD